MKFEYGVLMVVALLSPSSGVSQVVHESQTDSSTAPSTICKASVLALRSEV